MTGLVDETIDVAVPALYAYEQWTRFDEYPEFVENVERVTRNGDELTWVGKPAGTTREWAARIITDEPGRRLAWMAPDGPIDTDIRFEAVGDNMTRVRFRERMHSRALSHAESGRGLVERRARADLERYKRKVEGAFEKSASA